jgi:hypothetical protein
MAKRDKRIISLAVCGLVLAAGLTVKPAMAYFTDYATASGTVEISVKDPPTDITERVSDWTKRITIQNTGDVDCFIRVAAIAPEDYILSADSAGSLSEGWSAQSDGYYYYNHPVAPGESTSELNLKITGQEAIENDEQGYLPSEFNVIILQESAKVLYQEDGTPYADWNQAISTDPNAQEGGQ